MAIIHKNLCQAVQLKHDEIGTEPIVVVYEHATYSKVLKIQQKYQKKAAFLAFIAKRFCHAGLRDIAIKCGVIDVGTVGRLLDYKAYKRQISYYKVIYETC